MDYERAVESALRRMHQGWAVPEPAAHHLLDRRGWRRLSQMQRAVQRRIGWKCRDCSSYFDRQGTAAVYCPACRERRAAELEAKRQADKLCRNCGRRFRPRGRALRCADCLSGARRP